MNGLSGLGGIVQNNIDSLIYGTDLTSIVGLTGIDLYTSEDHAAGVEATKLAIESGATVTDHACVDPVNLTLKGVVSNIQTIINGIPLIIGAPSIINNAKPMDAWAQIEALKDARNPLNIVTALKVYQNMLIVGLAAPINVNTGTNLYFTIDFQEVRIVGSEVVQFPPSKVSSGPAANKTSKVNGGERQSGAPNESVAAKALDWIES